MKQDSPNGLRIGRDAEARARLDTDRVASGPEDSVFLSVTRRGGRRHGAVAKDRSLGVRVRGLLILLGGLIAAFGTGVLLFNFVLMPRFVQHAASVQVPSLVGRGWVEAKAECARVGLEVAVEDRRHSAGIPSDQVLSQFPEAGAAVKPGRTVRVHLSLGSEQVTIPDVRGMSLRQATLQLENANLSVGRIARVYDTQESSAESSGGGQVVQAMRPRPGSAEMSGGRVDLVVAVSGNPEPYLMPDLVGRSLEDVRELVESRGFRVGRVTYRGKPGVYPGTILETFPARGALIVRGETIDLVAATPD